MPYVRTHGNQIAIVHGERDKASGKVQQRQLFTFYSKAEAAAAIGDKNSEDAQYFESLLEDANPQMTFDWIELKTEIRSRIDLLPEIYPLRKARSEEGFGLALLEFSRQIAISDPYNSKVGRQTLSSFREELSVVQKLISLRLAEFDAYIDQGDSPFELDDSFCWRYEVQAHSMPLGLEEYADTIYRTGNYDEAKPLYALLTKVFPEFSEGYNCLGLMALKEDQPKEAVEYFRSAAKYGRNLFPRRMAKAHYWGELSTRPYMRALMNLALALNCSAEFRECLTICDQLEKECGEKGTEAAWAHRSSAYLNLHRFEEAAAAALKIANYAPSEGFNAGYALYELGRVEDSILWFLHAAMSNPHTVMMLCDQRKLKPVTYTEIEDHNAGVELIRQLPRFFKMQSKGSVKFFRKLIGNEAVKSVLLEAIACQRRHADRNDRSRENLTRWNEIMSLKFAKKLSKEVSGSLKSPK